MITTTMSVYGNTDIMKEVLLFIQTITGSAEYRSLITVFLTIGLGIAVFKGSMNLKVSHKESIIHFLVTATLLYGLYNPKVTVILNNEMAGAITSTTSYQIPLGIAYAMHFGSEIQKGLVNIVNLGTSLTPSEEYGSTSYSWAPTSLTAMSGVGLKTPDPYLYETVNDFFAECVLTGVLMHEINIHDLMSSQDLLTFIDPSNYGLPPVWTSIIYTSGGSISSGCQNSYYYIHTKLLAAQTTTFPMQFSNIMAARTNDKLGSNTATTYLGQVGTAIIQSSLTGEQMLMQAVMTQSFNNGIRDFAITYNTDPNFLAYTTTNALDKSVHAMDTSSYLAKEFLPWLHVLIEALVYATMPLAFFAMFLPGLTKKVMYTYITLILWISFWGPMIDIINDLVNVHAANAMSEYGGVLTLQTFPHIVTEASALQAMAGSLLWAVPILAFSMASLSTFGFTSVATSIGGTLHSAGMGAGAAIGGIEGQHALGGVGSGLNQSAADQGVTAEKTIEGDAVRGWEMYGSNQAAFGMGKYQTRKGAAGNALANIDRGAGTDNAINQFGNGAMQNASAASTASNIGAGSAYGSGSAGMNSAASTATTGTQETIGDKQAVRDIAKTLQGMGIGDGTVEGYSYKKTISGGMGKKFAYTDKNGDVIQGALIGAGKGQKILTATFAVGKNNRQEVVDRLNKAGLKDPANMVNDMAAKGQYGMMTEETVIGTDGKKHLAYAGYKAGGSATYQSNSYSQTGKKVTSGQDIKVGNQVIATVSSAGKDFGTNYAVTTQVMKDIGITNQDDIKGGKVNQDGSEIAFSGILSKKGVEHMIKNGTLRGHSAYVAEQAIKSKDFSGFKVNMLGSTAGGRPVAAALSAGTETLVNESGTINRSEVDNMSTSYNASNISRGGDDFQTSGSFGTVIGNEVMNPHMSYGNKVGDEIQIASNIKRADHFGNSSTAYNQIASEGTNSVLGYMDKKYQKKLSHASNSVAGGEASVDSKTPGFLKFIEPLSANAKVYIGTSIKRDLGTSNTISVNQFKSDVYKDLRGITGDTTLSSSQRAVKMQKYLEGLGKNGASFANYTGIGGTGFAMSNNMNLKGKSPAHNPANYDHSMAEEAEE